MKLALFLFVLITGSPLLAADSVPSADGGVHDRCLHEMRALHQQRKWKELIEAYGTEDFASWPPEVSGKASEALHLRGRIYSFTKDGPRAEADLQAAVKVAPKDAAIRLDLAENYVNNLNDDEKALAAYRDVIALTGTGPGWQPLTATIGMARIYTDQVKPDEAMETLKPHGFGEALPANWRIRILRTYGQVFAAQGKETESLKMFREALTLEVK